MLERYWTTTKRIRLNPEYSMAYYNRGNAYRLQRQLLNPSTIQISDMAPNYNQAIDMAPGYIDAYYNRGLVYIAEDNPKRDVEQAKKDYLRRLNLILNLTLPNIASRLRSTYSISGVVGFALFRVFRGLLRLRSVTDVGRWGFADKFRKKYLRPAFRRPLTLSNGGFSEARKI